MARIEPATVADVDTLMNLERGEGFERLVGRWNRAEHAAEMAKAGSHYLVARRPDGTAAGFVLLQDLDQPHGCATLRRIAVARPGEGLGPRLLEAALAHTFTATPTHRLQLRVYPENTRARRAYARAGFFEEGLLRGVSRAPDGAFRSMLMMSMLGPEWTALHVATAAVKSVRTAPSDTVRDR